MKKIIMIAMMILATGLLITACSEESQIRSSSPQDYKELKKQADPIAIDSNNLKIEQGKQTELGVAIKNPHESKAEFTVKPTCNNAQGQEVDLLQNKKGSISANKTAVINLGVNSDMEKMYYICSVQISSDQGFKASKELLVEIA